MKKIKAAVRTTLAFALAVSLIMPHGAALAAENSYIPDVILSSDEAAVISYDADNLISKNIQIDENKDYIVKYDGDTALLDSEEDDSLPFSVVDGETMKDLLTEDSEAVEWYEEDIEVELFDADMVNANITADSVESAENYSCEAYEPLYDTSSWELKMVNADFAYKLNCTGSEIRVGVIDSGVAAHEDLKDSLTDGYNYITNSSNTTDTYGHGTFVSGIIAAENSKTGYEGIAPDVKIVPVKCFDGKTTNISVVCKGIYGAVDDLDCDIINMSIGIKTQSAALDEAIAHAEKMDTIMIAAVGNYGSAQLCYPAAYDSVIGVAAVNSSGEVWEESSTKGSQYNESVFVSAPGQSVSGLKFSGGYTTGTGTSFAAPFVTAAAAVMKSADPDLDTDELKKILETTSVDKGDEGYDVYYGYGILDIEACLRYITGNDSIYIAASDDDTNAAVSDGSTSVNRSVIVANLTDSAFAGKLMKCSYYDYNDDNTSDKATAAADISQADITVPASSAVRVTFNDSGETVSGDDPYKYFVWNSIENNKVISNTLSTGTGGAAGQPSEKQIIIDANLSEIGEGETFALAVSSETTAETKDDGVISQQEAELIYAVQDIVPDGGIYKLAVPQSAVMDAGSEVPACKVRIKAWVSGDETPLEAAAHNYVEKEKSEPTKTESGWIRYECSVCKAEYTETLEPTGYTVSYDANGGSGAPESQNKRPGISLALTSDEPVRDGWTFLGWAADSSSQEPRYSKGDSYAADDDITLYAVWSANTYNITYMADGVVYKVVPVKCGDVVTPEAGPEKSGYNFKSWKNLPATMPPNDITVEAEYTAKSSGGGGGGGGGSSSTSSKTDIKTDETKKDTDGAAELMSYTDVNEGIWYYDGVRFVTQKGIMNGVSETEFMPDAKLTRGMFVTILYRVAGSPDVNNADADVFTDVSKSAYYHDAVVWAYTSGIVNGITSDRFEPDTVMTREQSAAMIYRYAKLKNIDVSVTKNVIYTDSELISEYARDAVSWASEKGLLEGYDGGAFCPRSSATRAHTAVLIQRMYEKNCI